MVADLETPVATYLKLANSQPNSFLLESVTDGDVRGRYSMIGLDPDLIFRFKDGVCELNAQFDTDRRPLSISMTPRSTVTKGFAKL